jgi:hypothetical protein
MAYSQVFENILSLLSAKDKEFSDNKRCFSLFLPNLSDSLPYKITGTVAAGQ